MGIQFAQIIFFLAVYIHIYACVWWLIVRDSQTWCPIVQLKVPKELRVYFLPIATQYTLCLHYSLLCLVGVDTQPKDTIQTSYTAIGIILGSIINANIFG